MPDLLPDDVLAETNDVPDPMELLEFQAERLKERTQGRLEVELPVTTSDDRHVIRFVAVVVSHDYRSTIFEVHYRPGLLLPASFVPPEPFPAFLREKYTIPAMNSVISNVMSASRVLNTPRTVQNPWVANTPVEFRDKLQELLSSQEVKAQLAALLSMARRPPNAA